MGDDKIEMLKDEWFRRGSNIKDDSSWMINEGNNSSQSSSSIGESTISNSTCSSSLETMDDASSPASSSDGALSDLSSLMAQLPIKRGLSEYYEGKSESFTCLARVKSVEDLAKKENGYSRKMKKSCKSSYKSYTLPKPIIFKKATRSSFLSSCYTTRKTSSSISRSRHPLIPVQRT